MGSLTVNLNQKFIMLRTEIWVKYFDTDLKQKIMFHNPSKRIGSQADVKVLIVQFECDYSPGCQVSVSDNLYHFIHELWLQNAPIGELS
jgi:hypothetical protein